VGLKVDTYFAPAQKYLPAALQRKSKRQERPLGSKQVLAPALIVVGSEQELIP
jgi:hypothetical protein